jgi:hypothetical protein
MIFWLLKCSQGVYLKAGSHRSQEIKRRSSLQQIIWNFTVKVARKSRSFRLTIINNYESSLAIPIFCHDPIAQLPCPLPRVPYKNKTKKPNNLPPSSLQPCPEQTLNSFQSTTPTSPMRALGTTINKGSHPAMSALTAEPNPDNPSHGIGLVATTKMYYHVSRSLKVA